MKRLFIIGNGFDLAHGIHSSYEDFREFLVSKLGTITGKKYDNFDFTDSSILTNDYIKTPENDLLTILYFLSVAEYDGTLNIEWKNIEKSVGELDFSEFENFFIDESEDDKEYRANWINYDMFLPYVDLLTEIPNYFREWIWQISLYNVSINKNIQKFFDSNTVFLCFNYTNTLERVYNVSRNNICYIHGNANEKTNIYFGHGNDLTYDNFINSISNDNYYSVAEEYCMINDILRKPVMNIIDNNLDFFKSLNNIDQIYSYGFSYGLVDQPYIRKICEYIPQNCEWYINSYPEKMQKETFKNIINNCGYKGIVKEF